MIKDSIYQRYDYYIKSWKNKLEVIVPEEVKTFRFMRVYYYKGPHITNVPNFKHEYGVLTPGFWHGDPKDFILDFPCLAISADGVNSESLPALVKNRYINDKYGAILCPIEWNYAWGTLYSKTFQEIEKNSTKWENKINKVVWRGAPTGIEKPGQNMRINACIKYGHIYNIGLSTLLGYRWPNENKFLKDKLSITEQLKYKYQLSFEGNCYATDLKWKLASNSIVLMCKPKIETWLMEGLLEPYIHYVPIKDDLSDLDKIIQWCKENDEKCKNIVTNANIFMEQFMDITVEKKLFNMIKEHYKKSFTFI
jgi:hypothetical protein